MNLLPQEQILFLYKLTFNEREVEMKTAAFSPESIPIHLQCLRIAAFDGWMDDLQFHVLFNSISVISGQWEVDNEKLCAMKPCLQWRRFCLEQGSNSGPLDPLSYRGSLQYLKKNNNSQHHHFSPQLIKWMTCTFTSFSTVFKS